MMLHTLGVQVEPYTTPTHTPHLHQRENSAPKRRISLNSASFDPCLRSGEYGAGCALGLYETWGQGPVSLNYSSGPQPLTKQICICNLKPKTIGLEGVYYISLYTTPYCAILYHTILYYTILYYTILYYTILYYTILYYTILYYTILYYTIPYYTILYYTILYYTILYYTILYSTILYCTVLY